MHKWRFLVRKNCSKRPNFSLRLPLAMSKTLGKDNKHVFFLDFNEDADHMTGCARLLERLERRKDKINL